MFGAIILPVNFPAEFQKLLTLSAFLNPATNASEALLLSATLSVVLANLKALYAVLLATTGVAPPRVTTSNAAKANSSTAILDNIPTV